MNKKDGRIDSLLNKFCNAHGFPLSVECRRRIKKYLINPTYQGWHDIHAIVIWNAPVINIWTQVCHCNYFLDVTGREYVKDEAGEWTQVSEWENVPSPIELLVSLESFFNEETNTNNKKHRIHK